MRWTRFEDLEEYQPAGHDGVVNRLLAGAQNWGLEAVSVWHGRLEPGGHSDFHDHPDSIQIYVGLEGVLHVGNGKDECELTHLGATMFAAGELHRVENRSDADATLLVITLPGLR